MKKIIALILCLLLCFSAVACTPTPDPTEPSGYSPADPTIPSPTEPSTEGPTDPTKPTSPTEPSVPDPTDPTEPEFPAVGELTEEFVRNYPATPLTDFVYHEYEYTHIGTGEIIKCMAIDEYIGADCIIIFPDEINGIPVTSIKKEIYGRGSGIRAVVFPVRIINLPDMAFENNYEIEVVIAESVTHLRGYTFIGCGELRVVKLSNELISIATAEFMGCANLEYLYIPASLSGIACLEGDESYVFHDCPKLTIYGEDGSYIQTFCATYGIPFQVVE